MKTFFKYQGTGNDFLLFDDRDLSFPLENRGLISQLCHRRFGVGADGIILLQEDSVSDFRVRIFNADGQETASCGNALNCLVRFLIDQGYPHKTYQFQIMHRIVTSNFEKGFSTTFLGKPSSIEEHDLMIEGNCISVDFVNTGVPHAVLVTEHLSKVDVKTLGRKIRFHPAFPEGTNVNFIERQGDEIHVRTYERGVEDETLGCGTGAAASALVAAKKWGIATPISLYFPGGKIEVSFAKEQENINNIKLIGTASYIFSGQTDLNGEGYGNRNS